MHTEKGILIRTHVEMCDWERPLRRFETTTALLQVKQFILDHTLIKSTTETHTATLAGPHSAFGDNGIFSTRQLALTCWVVNRLQAIILSIHGDVQAESGNRNRGDKSCLLLWVWYSSFALTQLFQWTRKCQGHNILHNNSKSLQILH